LWFFGLPMAYYLSVLQGGGINAAWSTVWPPYVIILVTLTIAVVRADWDRIANDIRIREGVELLVRRQSSTSADSVLQAEQQHTLPLIDNKFYGTL
jgi:hypothetical protein